MKKTAKQKSARQILLMGVFWRILIIEGALLVFSLGFRWVAEDVAFLTLFWHSIRIIGLVLIIILFMMITLRKFLDQRIIAPLEAITDANKKLQEGISGGEHIQLPKNTPHEIITIASSRSKMLKTIFDISEERLKYSNALNSELEKGKRIQNDFLPKHIPDIKNCDTASFFLSALQLSGDFYDLFELPDKHIGFVMGDVSDKGVGAALFMALVRSLLRIFSRSNDIEKSITQHNGTHKNFSPENALKAVSLTNEYLSKEHNGNGMFVTLFFCIIDLSSGKIFYINGGHEPAMIVGKDGIKSSLKPTGPALGPIKGAVYTIESVQLSPGDILFSYTDGVTEARSETKDFYTRKRLENLLSKGFGGNATVFLETIKTDLFRFIKEAPQSDDITMLAVKWSSISKQDTQ